MAVLKPLSGSGEAPQQYKQSSRKGKKAWRKNVDISEVEQGLDALRDEIIRGGVTAEKDSADLFAIDTVGDTSTSSRRRRATKTLKADEIIAQRSAVPAVSLRKRPSAGTSDGILPVKRQRRDWVSHGELARLRKVADGQHNDSSLATRDATYDVWGDIAASSTTNSAEQKDEENFITPVIKAKVPKSLTKKPISLAASGKSVPAVSKPSGAHSYNPLFDEYANRLQEESEKAVEAEKKRLSEEEAERLRAEASARSAAEADAAEARADLSEWDEDSAWEGFDTEAEDQDEGPRKLAKRKTTVQRNRVKRRKAEEGRTKHEAAMKKRDAQAERIRQIAADVAEREARRQALVHLQGSDSESTSEETGANEVQLRRKKLGRAKLPEADLELVLPDELEDSLRRLKPEGNLLKDRYRSLLVRGKLETRKKRPFRKVAKVKTTEKWSYKDFRI